ncbi:PP2C family protein-serine/threonine phosphatase [Streptomyces sp. NBC_01089]|uniref:PP2C family protein-serine/threonine phosphatase n=1 Tax=Streptomyces sp. NBC_01089 TaxID=2903747 RepID=UPI003868E964|nr:serine/threonine-protein phosphatase [Streptomyces sp. NBC_01089]
MGLRQPFAYRLSPRQTGNAMVALPLGLIAAIVLTDVLTPNSRPMGPSLLVVAPALAASFASTLVTGMIAALAVVGMLVIGMNSHLLDTLQFEQQVIALLAVSALVTLFRYLRERRARELAQVRMVSEATQRVVLRPLPRRIGPLRVASMYMAAQEHASIGGDLYAAVRTPTSTRVIIGDVKGKGLTAIGDAAFLLGAFREAAHRQATLPGLMAYLEHSVSWNLTEPIEAETAGECFITAAVIDIPDGSPRVEMVSCGHPPPLLLHEGQATLLPAVHPAPPLGLGGLTRTVYHVDTFTMEPGDLLVLYTDGVIEARNARGAFYPLTERAAVWTDETPTALIHTLQTDLLAHVGGRLDDDAAVVALQRDLLESGLQ